MLDVQKPVPGLVSHTVLVRAGEVAVGDAATTIVDEAYRRGANRAHSATHLVHAALRQILGREAHQAGSYNKAGYLRLDFNWSQALSPQTRSEIEDVANRAISDDLEVTTRILPIEQARAEGAMALFGEKYGDTVRVVRIGGDDWSLELCAGTHVARSSDVGLIDLIGESSVGSSARRVEALVGADALASFKAEREIVGRLSAELKTPRDQLVTRIASLGEQLRAAEKRIAQYESRALADRVPALVAAAAPLGGVAFVGEDVGVVGSADDLRTLATSVRERLAGQAAVVAIAGRADGKPAVIVATTPAARETGARAGALAKAAAAALGGGGGGKDDLAQGGGSDPSAIPAAIEAIARELRSA